MISKNRYVALLRGIGPGNPNMHGSKLCNVFEKLGFTNVASVISSGNVIFDSPSKNIAGLESEIEKALPKYLGFSSTTIIRSQNDLRALVGKNPFKNKEHSLKTYLIVTFLKDKKLVPGGVICTTINMGQPRTPKVMADLEKKYAKAVTTRTWLTILRILKKMESID
jgi:hypothetical protein